MKKRVTYKGELNGVKGIWCDTCPENLILEEKITYYVPDKGNIFVKDDVQYNIVILKKKEKITDYTEIAKPEEEEETEEELQENN